MLVSKAQIVVGLVLLMSSASVEAMEFGDRPGVKSPSFAVARLSVSHDRLRRQIGNCRTLYNKAPVQLKITDRPRPLFTVIDDAVVSSKHGPGRLSAEFSAVSWSSKVKLDPRRAVSIRRKPNVIIGEMKFEDRPGPVSNPFAGKAAAMQARMFVASH
jgi:hypothetical protein